MPALAFGDIILDPHALEIRRQGELLDLEPKSFKVLAYLAAHPGRVITKEELLDNVWNGTQ
jgi:DNA-binding winged helix-turn-helix (wHTH) protein